MPRVALTNSHRHFETRTNFAALVRLMSTRRRVPSNAAWIVGSGTKQLLCSYDYIPEDGASSSASSRCLVVFLHGIGEHAMRYDSLFTRLTDAGCVVTTYDAVGHGASEGLPGYFEAFEDVVEDARGFCEAKRAEHATRGPLVLCGQSFGGLVAATVCVNDAQKGDKRLVDGLVLTAASIDVKWNAILRAQAAMGALLAKSAPRARLVPAVRLEDMSDDAATLDSYATDPYVQLGPVRCRTAYEILRGFRALRARYRELSCPLLVLHGSDDACADKTASRRLVLEASSMDKQYVELPGMHHLILQEPGSKDVLNRIVDFVDSRASARTSGGRVGVGARSALPSKL